MPTYKARWLLGKDIDRFEQDLRKRGLSETTIKGYVSSVRHGFEMLWSGGYDTNPRRYGEDRHEFLGTVVWGGVEQSTRSWCMSNVRQFVSMSGGETDGLVWPARGDESPNADWLEPHEAMRLKRDGIGIERMIVHLELDLGFRRIEVLRCKVEHFSRGRRNSIVIHGKGRRGGKYRSVAWHKDTAKELDDYLRIRGREIDKARAKNPRVEVPPYMFIYERGGELHPYKKSAMENFLKNLSEKTGIEFSNHTLRRTCGNMMWRAGVRIEAIAAQFGHSDTKTTLRYLGLNLDDSSEAMDKLAQYQETIDIPTDGISDGGQQNGGPCGI